MKLEDKYLIWKRTDLRAILITEEESKLLCDITNRINIHRALSGKGYLSVIVIEKDWPEYDPTLELLSERVDKDEEKINFDEQRKGR